MPRQRSVEFFGGPLDGTQKRIPADTGVTVCRSQDPRTGETRVYLYELRSEGHIPVKVRDGWYALDFIREIPPDSIEFPE